MLAVEIENTRYTAHYKRSLVMYREIQSVAQRNDWVEHRETRCYLSISVEGNTNNAVERLLLS